MSVECVTDLIAKFVTFVVRRDDLHVRYKTGQMSAHASVRAVPIFSKP